MTPTPVINLPPSLDRDAVLERLDKVVDPELDESILSLGNPLQLPRPLAGTP